MPDKKAIRKVCSNGHVFYKSSDCPVCPVCEKQKKPVEGFLADISSPARRALEKAGITTVTKLSAKKEAEILQLHGIGPSALPILRNALKQKGMTFKK